MFFVVCQVFLVHVSGKWYFATFFVFMYKCLNVLWTSHYRPPQKSVSRRSSYHLKLGWGGFYPKLGLLHRGCIQGCGKYHDFGRGMWRNWDILNQGRLPSFRIMACGNEVTKPTRASLSSMAALLESQRYFNCKLQLQWTLHICDLAHIFRGGTDSPFFPHSLFLCH